MPNGSRGFKSFQGSRLNFLPQVAGGRNVPGPILYVAIKSIEHSRQMRYQSLNAYRKRFFMKPYSSFEDLTGEITQLQILVLIGGKDDVRRFIKEAIINVTSHHQFTSNC